MIEACPLAKEWQTFRHNVLIDYSPEGAEKMRWSFYAGASSFYALMLGSKDPAAMMADITRELLEFAEYVRQQREQEQCCSRPEADSK